MENRYYANTHSMKIMDNLTGDVVIENIWIEPDFLDMYESITTVLENTDLYVERLNEEYAMYNTELEGYVKLKIKRLTYPHHLSDDTYGDDTYIIGPTSATWKIPELVFKIGLTSILTFLITL